MRRKREVRGRRGKGEKRESEEKRKVRERRGTVKKNREGAEEEGA